MSRALHNSLFSQNFIIQMPYKNPGPNYLSRLHLPEPLTLSYELPLTNLHVDSMSCPSDKSDILEVPMLSEIVAQEVTNWVWVSFTHG